MPGHPAAKANQRHAASREPPSACDSTVTTVFMPNSKAPMMASIRTPGGSLAQRRSMPKTDAAVRSQAVVRASAADEVA